jgi:hypothetical protein
MGLCQSSNTTQPNNMIISMHDSSLLFSLELHNILIEKRNVVMSGYSTELIIYTGYTNDNVSMALFEISHYPTEINTVYKTIEEMYPRKHTTIHERNEIQQSNTVFIFDGTKHIVTYFIVNDKNTYTNHSLIKFDSHKWSILNQLTENYSRIASILLIELICLKNGKHYTYHIHLKRNGLFQVFNACSSLYYVGDILKPDYIVLAKN